MIIEAITGGTPARRKMIDVMDLKGLSPGTKDNCLRRVSALARFHDRAPATLSAEKVAPGCRGGSTRM